MVVSTKEKKQTSKITYYIGTGRRKTSVARVRLTNGTGKILINGRTPEDYIGGRPMLHLMLKQPFIAVGQENKFDAFIDVCGGGIVGQVGAIRLGIARALLNVNPEYRQALKAEGHLTRDPRTKERKKYGQKRARKKFQFSKR